MKVKFEIMMDVDKDKIENIKKLEHHADYLLDLDSYPEINSIYNCRVFTEDEAEKEIVKATYPIIDEFNNFLIDRNIKIQCSGHQIDDNENEDDSAIVQYSNEYFDIYFKVKNSIENLWYGNQSKYCLIDESVETVGDLITLLEKVPKDYKVSLSGLEDYRVAVNNGDKSILLDSTDYIYELIDDEENQ